ncbi:MAG: septum site-determining protein MinC [Eubacteriales bacterium]|nr:septum site-determining protein MinC [Eubacteriales bacterium]
MNENSVIFKGIQNGILIMLDSEIPFEELKTSLDKKVVQAKDFFEGANISITFKGRDLTENEELELLEVISKKSGLEISFVNSEKFLNTKIEESPEKSILAPPILTAKNNITYYHKGSLRSGQRIDFSGSVIIIGDVNPGAQVFAEGNIIVLGKLKGSVHAGCKGAEDCFISALHMNPIQLIIKDVITFFPEDLEKERGPEFAYVKDGQIFVESLIN